MACLTQTLSIIVGLESWFPFVSRSVNLISSRSFDYELEASGTDAACSWRYVCYEPRHALVTASDLGLSRSHFMNCLSMSSTPTGLAGLMDAPGALFNYVEGSDHSTMSVTLAQTKL